MHVAGVGVLMSSISLDITFLQDSTRDTQSCNQFHFCSYEGFMPVIPDNIVVPPYTRVDPKPASSI